MGFGGEGDDDDDDDDTVVVAVGFDFISVDSTDLGGRGM